MKTLSSISVNVQCIILLYFYSFVVNPGIVTRQASHGQVNTYYKILNYFMLSVQWDLINYLLRKNYFLCDEKRQIKLYLEAVYYVPESPCEPSNKLEAFIARDCAACLMHVLACAATGMDVMTAFFSS
jgi:hypothetical protein